MTERGLAPERADADALSERTAASGRRLRALVAPPYGLTAFTTGNDVMAVRLMDALEDAGLRVPADVSMVGFDGIELGGWSRIGLTTVAQPRGRLIEDGLRLLAERMRGEDGPPRHARLQPELVVRGTTA
jgi:LacI family transcriptional regulator